MRDSVLEQVQAQLPPHFQDAQFSVANHRKNCVSLYRLHARCTQVTEQTERGTRLVGEKAFNETFFGCLHRVLGLKRGVKNADRICKFAATYAAYILEQFAAQDEDTETPAMRFVTILLKHLLKGFRAKNKHVRLRCCHCVSLLINVMDCLDDDLFETLLTMLMERLTDREAAIRVQAVIALARLQTDEDGTEDHTLRLLLHILRHDSSAEVRRAALFNIPPTPTTLPYLLERLQDVDATNRRCVYLGSLKMLLDTQPLIEREDGLTVREALGLGEVSLSEVVRIGLHERDQSVRKAARKLVSMWLEATGFDILALLNLLHVSRSANGEPVVLALLEDMPALRSQVTEILSQQDVFWQDMSPAKALLARCFVMYCTTHALERELDTCIPVVTALVFRIQAEYDALNQVLEQQAEEEAQDDDMPILQDNRAMSRVFVVSEMLTIAMYCDYGDEMGRQKMYMLVREMLGNAWLPAELVPRCLDVLLRLSSGHRDFLQMVVELVQSLDEDMVDPDASVRQALSWHQRVHADNPEMTPQRAANKAALEARRLLIVQSMLERIACSLQDDTSLEGLIQELIVPTIQSRDVALREQGIVCLGLCSVLDEKAALVTFPLLLSQIQRAQGSIRTRCVECLFDLTIVHGIDALCSQSAEVAAENEFDGDREQGLQYARQQMVNFLLSLLEHDDPNVQTIASEGMAKLMLTGTLVEDDVLKSLILTYMSPYTADHSALRQCLSYFLPLFCSSHVRHQHMVQRVFCDTMDVLVSVYEDASVRSQMITPSQMATQFIDWCHPSRLLLSEPDEWIHMDLGIKLLEHALTSTSKELRKALVHVLGKLAWPARPLDSVRATKLDTLAKELRARADDASMRLALSRFEAALAKHTEGLPDAEALASLTPLLASLPPVKSAPASRSAQRRTARSPSIQAETEDEAEEDIEDEEDEEDDEDELAL